MKHLFLIALLWTTVTCATLAAGALPVRYSVTKLFPGYRWSEASAVNNKGDILAVLNNARSLDDVYGSMHYVFMRSGHKYLLNFFPDGMNNEGYVVGYSGYAIGGVVWNKGKVMPIPGTYSANSVNNQGDVVGWTGKKTRRGMYDISHRHAFRWHEGRLQDLGTLPGCTQSEAEAINDNGQIVGTMRTYRRTLSNRTEEILYPCLWEKGQWSRLSALECHWTEYAKNRWQGTISIHYAINQHGQVLIEHDDTDLFSRSVLWNNGHVVSLGNVDAIALNDKGQVVGGAFLPKHNDYRAFLWQNGRLQDLNDLISSHSGWKLKEAEGINDQGQIVGQGYYHGNECAFLLTPVLQTH